MNPGSDDVTIQSLIAELLHELGVSRTSLARYEALFRIFWNLIRLLVGIFSIINTVFSFIDGIDPVLKQVFLIINLVSASGLLGDFNGRAEKAKAEKQNIDTVKKMMLVSRSRLGSRLIPPPMIIDMPCTGPLLPPPRIPALPIVVNDSLILSDLVKDVRLKTAIVRVESKLSSNFP